MECSTDIKGSRTIMVVDDEKAIVNVVSLLLQECGHITIPCHSAAEALQQFEGRKIDLVLSDIKMPGMTGIELLERIHAFNHETPVILMTAYADLDVAIDAIRKGAFDFIIKPYNQEQLVHAVDKALKYRMLTEMEDDYRNILEQFNHEIEALISERTMNLMALTVADRVRNPATVIGGICRKLSAGSNVPEGMRASLEDIREEVAKLEQIVSDFHGVLRKRESLYAFADLNEVVRDAISIVEKEIHRRQLVLDVTCSDQPLRINMQRNLLKIAIFHLLGNAIEASQVGNVIAVSTRFEADRAMLTIIDSGSGISPEHIARIFDPFFSTKAHSFGMGLPLVKQIVTEHMGEIAVNSEPGKGTVFTLKFPIRWKQESPAQLQAAEQTS